MKKLKSLLVVCMIICASSSAFAGGAGGFGFKGGLAISTIGLDQESASEQSKKFRLGATGGISYEIATPKFFALDIELLYNLRGTKVRSDVYLFGSNVGTNVLKTNFNYISLPLSAKFYIGNNFNFHTCPYIAYCIGGQLKNTFTAINGDVTRESFNLFNENLKDANGNELFNRFDAGMHLGFEFVSNKGFGVGSRLSKGIVNVNNTKHALVSGRATTTEISIYGIVRFGGRK